MSNTRLHEREEQEHAQARASHRRPRSRSGRVRHLRGGGSAYEAAFRRHLHLDGKGICSFPLEVTSSFRGTETDFFDQGGELVRTHLHVAEQDTFSANGKTRTGEPYHFNIFISFENGKVTAVLARGVAEKIRLPNGELFLSAGVIDFLAQGVSFSIRTDRGRTGDIDGLCAALSP
jgi:hypothetical protein